MKKILLFGGLVLVSNYVIGQSHNVYLEKVLNNLNQIKSATYFYTASASAPGDTITFSVPQHFYYKEFVNPADPFVGASYARYKQEDTTKILEFYDGLSVGSFNWGEKTITIDSFKNYPYPFRLVFFPFFTRTASIINYALKTEDSTRIDLKDFGDSILFTLRIYDKVVEFVTKPFSNQSSAEKKCQYDIWINKSDGLPYRMRRKIPANTSFDACRNVTLNTLHSQVLNASDYFPAGFSIVPFERKKRKNSLEGKVAADWVLKDIDNNSVSLKSLTSKVLMIQFTGIGCGPCHESIPFLKQLVSDHKNRDFEFIAIENWSKNIVGMKRYQDRNELNFKFLKSEEDVIKNYQVESVPMFFVLDKNRVIRKVFTGYSPGKTDNEIRRVINGLFK